MAVVAVIADAQRQSILQPYAGRALYMNREGGDRIPQPTDLQMASVECPVLDLATVEIRHQRAVPHTPLDLALVGKSTCEVAAGGDEIIGPPVHRNRELAGREARAVDDRLEISGQQPLGFAEPRDAQRAKIGLEEGARRVGIGHTLAQPALTDPSKGKAHRRRLTRRFVGPDDDAAA